MTGLGLHFGGMASQRHRTRYPYSESVALADLGLNDEQLAAEAVASARDAIRACKELGLEPAEGLRQRAAGDPNRVAEFVDAYRNSGSDNAVA